LEVSAKAPEDGGFESEGGRADAPGKTAIREKFTDVIGFKVAPIDSASFPIQPERESFQEFSLNRLSS
jgi:hypothetical protein